MRGEMRSSCPGGVNLALSAKRKKSLKGTFSDERRDEKFMPRRGKSRPLRKKKKSLKRTFSF